MNQGLPIDEAVADGQRRSIPIVAQPLPAIEPGERRRLRDLAAAMLTAEPGLASPGRHDPLLGQGIGDEPALLIGDQIEIPLYDTRAAAALEYRVALLAQPGDLVVVSRRDRPFEHYLAAYLGLGGVQFLQADGRQRQRLPVCQRCRTDQELRRAVRAFAASAGRILLLSYLSTGHSWRMAKDIAHATGTAVRVCGPSPRLSRRANDKIWFADCVRQVIGEFALPASHAAYGPAAAAAHVARLCRKAPRVVVKVPDSAGSSGNIVLESDDIAGLSLGALRRRLVDLLRASGWHDRYPVLIGIWEADVVSSPSVQLWLPLAKDGPPVVEGVFEQRLEGTVGEFVGAVPATLSAGLRARLVSEAARLAYLLQALGYFGRCSFDAIIVAGRPQPLVHWIECNGRWGGVSFPMTLANRLGRTARDAGMVIIHNDRPNPQVRTTEDLIDRLHGLLYRAGSSDEGIVLVAPVDQLLGRGLYLLSLAGNQRRAEQLAAAAIATLVDQSGRTDGDIG